MILIVMGVSGCGKTTVGSLVAQRLGWAFRDADSFHPPENIAKMSAGLPLDDQDRKPWLLAIQAFMRSENAAGRSAVVACSALKRQYRDLLLFGDPQVRFAHLDGSRDLIATRLGERKGHFMPASLLDSQFATLEVSDDIQRFDIAAPPEAVASDIIDRLRLVR